MITKPTSKNKRGKQIKIDLQELENLCAMQCTDEELAAWFRCTRKTLNNRKRNPDFKEAYERGHLRGRASLRRIMWEKAQGQEAELLLDLNGKVMIDEKGRVMVKKPAVAPDTTMQIWLSKNLLGYADKVEHSGEGGKPITSVILTAEDLSDEQLADIIAGRSGAGTIKKKTGEEPSSPILPVRDARLSDSRTPGETVTGTGSS